jgi:hypothetical protein
MGIDNNSSKNIRGFLIDNTNLDKNDTLFSHLKNYNADSFESSDSYVFPTISKQNTTNHRSSDLSVASMIRQSSDILNGFSDTENSAPCSPIFEPEGANQFPMESQQELSNNQNTFLSPSRNANRPLTVISPPGSVKYSPLTSAKSLVMLMESPLVNGSGGKKKCRRKSSAPAEINEDTGVRKDPRRSLYRTKTSLNMS